MGEKKKCFSDLINGQMDERYGKCLGERVRFGGLEIENWQRVKERQQEETMGVGKWKVDDREMRMDEALE